MRVLPSPEQLVDYVDRAGWRRVGSSRYMALYETAGTDGEVRQVTLPLSPVLKDYASAVATLVGQLAEVEGRDPLTVSQSFHTLGADLVDVVAESSGPGAASLPVAHALFTGARGLLLASASAAVRPRAAFGDDRPEGAERYLDTVTASVVPGSFVVRLDCPLATPTGGQQLLLALGQEQEQVYGRRVTTMLADGIRTAVEVARSADGQLRAEPWRDTISHGVSADLVDALAAIAPRADGDPARQVSIDFARSVPAGGAEPTSIEIPPGIYRSLKHASEKLKTLLATTGAEIVGQVQGFERGRSGNEPDVVKILGLLTIAGGQPRRATVRVTAPELDQNLLIEGYRRFSTLHLRGEVIRRGRRYYMPVVTSVSPFSETPAS